MASTILSTLKKLNVGIAVDPPRRGCDVLSKTSSLIQCTLVDFCLSFENSGRTVQYKLDAQFSASLRSSQKCE